MLSLILRFMRLPFPLVVALMVVRSDIFRSSVRWAYLNRNLATKSGRASRRQQANAETAEASMEKRLRTTYERPPTERICAVMRGMDRS